MMRLLALMVALVTATSANTALAYRQDGSPSGYQDEMLSIVRYHGTVGKSALAELMLSQRGFGLTSPAGSSMELSRQLLVGRTLSAPLSNGVSASAIGLPPLAVDTSKINNATLGEHAAGKVSWAVTGGSGGVPKTPQGLAGLTANAAVIAPALMTGELALRGDATARALGPWSTALTTALAVRDMHTAYLVGTGRLDPTALNSVVPHLVQAVEVLKVPPVISTSMPMHREQFDGARTTWSSWATRSTIVNPPGPGQTFGVNPFNSSFQYNNNYRSTEQFNGRMFQNSFPPR